MSEEYRFKDRIKDIINGDVDYDKPKWGCPSSHEKEEKKKRLEYAGELRFIRRSPDQPSA